MIPSLVGATKKLDGWPSIMAISFFGAAAYVEWDLWLLSLAEPLQYIASQFHPNVLAVLNAIAFLASVFVVFVVYLIANALLSVNKIFRLLMGLSLLSFGVLGLKLYLPEASTAGVNAFWHLGALCWGLDIFGVGEKNEEPQSAGSSVR
ncbi:MAG: hypothetical protein C0463_07045 [Idiomarina sp.]|nr:hypothetical protein [Idiomarina sp.]